MSAPFLIGTKGIHRFNREEQAYVYSRAKQP